jgi:retron-type reverse transcriptase
MNLLRWIWSFFHPLRRDISRLESQPEQVDAVSEVIDTSGQPLKQGHHRRALRDPRLLPKPPRLYLPFRKRPHYLDGDEAGRLFAGTLRGRNRNLRDLLPDEEQLERYDLPPWYTEADLAAALGLTLKELRYFSIHRQADRTCHYVTFAIPKRSGGQRLIMAPKRQLKRVQRKLLELLVSKLPVSTHAHGFRPGRSIRSNAEPHVGKRILLRLDLRNFFPSVTFARVRGLLIALGYGCTLATVLAVLMTEAERQPVEVDGTVYHVPIGPRYCVQGAPTSPGLCNCITRRLDHRLAGLARRLGFAYTRYADDLTFSGDNPEAVQALKAQAIRIVKQEGFAINPQKTRIARRGSRQQVTGVTVNDKAGLSRKERRRLRAALHRLEQEKAHGEADPVQLRQVQGRLAYVAMLNPEQAAALQRSDSKE